MAIEHPIRLRRPVAADANQIASLLGELGYPTTADVVRRRLERLLALTDFAIVVAEGADKLHGLGAVNVLSAIHADEPMALISALVVSEAVRGTGVGRSILLELEREAQAHQCGRIIVTTATHRAGAHAFYERMGYAFTGKRYAKKLEPIA